jgi:hypothetical protein
MLKLVAMLTSLATLTACGRGATPRMVTAFFCTRLSGRLTSTGLKIEHRLMAAGEYDLALRAPTHGPAFSRV